MDIFALLEVPDFVRAGSVCSSWRAATPACASDRGQYRQQQTPCLLYTSESAGSKAVGLYSLAEKKAYTLTLPDPPICTRDILGSSYGWISTADERCELHLVNPINGEQIALPSVSTIEQVKPIFDDTGDICKYEYSWYAGEGTSILVPSELRDFLLYKAFLSSDPSTGDYFVVLIHNPRSQLSFARAGDDKWTWLPPHNLYEDCLFQDGLLYASTSLGEIHAFDLVAPASARKIVADSRFSISDRIYIVQAPCGELMQVWRSDTFPLEDEEDEYDSELEPELDHEADQSNTNTIKLYSVNLTSKELVEVNTLGEYVLFIGRNQSLCLSAKDYTQLETNHAYFTDDNYIDISFYKNDRRDIGVFNLENNSQKEIVSPQLWSNSPTPVWLIPNPRRIMNLALQN
ncbi:hypothetical protein PVAP13_3NG057131 [Panicum virgatum]|uniref:KIB1-4 beta-propeller domain-containing protein n=1 Tax=Panicum virgatum TaxID=38727 RepID=A0A8T0U1H1_PANVG|nr:hypothetical protein PVAP13_3NG057131 [Panicum virgatum]